MSLLSRAKKLLRGKEVEKTGQPHSAQAPRGDMGSVSDKEHSRAAAANVNKPQLSVLAAHIGLTPLLTEKSFEAQAAAGAAAFQVTLNATKQEIARAVREQYGTKVLAVRTTRMRGKIRRRGVTYGKTPRWKKAYVKVEDIQKLQVNP